MTPPSKGAVIERAAPTEQERQDDLRKKDRGEALQAERLPQESAQQPESEHTHDAVVGEGVPLTERLIVAPCCGRFHIGAVADKVKGEYVLEGQEIGRVLSSDREVVPVKSAFSGWVMGYLIPEGAPVREAEPVAWLRPH